MIKIDYMQLFKKPIAHRGFWNSQYPENSMGAFIRATDNGYPIELDVQLSSDNEVIVFHDESVDRLTEAKGAVYKFKYEQLKHMKICQTNYTIPHFSDVLSEIDGKVPLLIEIKSTNKNKLLCDKIVKTLLNYKGEFALQSFNPFIIKYLKDRYPILIRGQLAKMDYSNEVSKLKGFLLKRMFFNSTTKPHFISYNFEDIPNQFVDKYKKRNIALLAWTIRNQNSYDKIKEYVDNIIFESFEPK